MRVIGSMLGAILGLGAPLAAQTAPVDLTATTASEPLVFSIGLECGGTELSRDFRVFEEAPPVPGAAILAKYPGAMSAAAESDDLAQVIESVVLAGSACDFAENLSALDPETVFLAETVREVGAIHPGVRLARSYFAHPLTTTLPLEYVDACLTALAGSGADGVSDLRAALSTARASFDIVEGVRDGTLDGQFMVMFNQAAFELSKELARCAFDTEAGPGALDRVPTLLARAEAVERLGQSVRADGEIAEKVSVSGTWRVARRGWGATALVRAEGEGTPRWFGYACTLIPDGTYQWAFVAAIPEDGPWARLQVDAATYRGALSGRNARRFAGIGADFRYLDVGAAADEAFGAIRAARDMRLAPEAAAGGDTAFSTRGSARALQDAQDHCAGLVAQRAD